MRGHSTTQAVENHSEKTLLWDKFPFLFFCKCVWDCDYKKEIRCHLKVYEKAGYFFRWIPEIKQESLSFNSKVDDTLLYIK